MAVITVTYNDFEEMREMARQILGLGGGIEPDTKGIGDEKEPSVPLAPAAPTTAVQPAAVPISPAPMAQPAAIPAAPTAAAQPAAVPTAPATAAPVPGTVPTSVREYTLDDLARAGMSLMEMNRQADLQQLLNVTFGVEALPALPKEQYGAFATALREMGAKI